MQQQGNVLTKRYAFHHLGTKEIFHKHSTHKIKTRPGTALRVLVEHLQVQQDPKDRTAKRLGCLQNGSGSFMRRERLESYDEK